MQFTSTILPSCVNALIAYPHDSEKVTGIWHWFVKTWPPFKDLWTTNSMLLPSSSIIRNYGKTNLQQKKLKTTAIKRTQPTTTANKSNSSANYNNINSHYNHQASFSPNSWPCSICTQLGHPMSHCLEYINLNRLGKHNLIFKLGWCFNCLGVCHLQEDCQSEGKCFHCGSNHHTTLCSEEN